MPSKQCPQNIFFSVAPVFVEGGCHGTMAQWPVQASLLTSFLSVDCFNAVYTRTRRLIFPLEWGHLDSHFEGRRYKYKIVGCRRETARCPWHLKILLIPHERNWKKYLKHVYIRLIATVSILVFARRNFCLIRVLAETKLGYQLVQYSAKVLLSVYVIRWSPSPIASNAPVVSKSHHV